MRRPILLRACAITLFLSWNLLFIGPLPFGPTTAQAQEDWKSEFNAVCSKTDMAMTLSAGELKDLVAQCDKLKPRIEAEEESTRKVYLRRLQMCRDLFTYVLESKKSK